MSYQGPTCTTCGGSGGTTDTVITDDGQQTGVWHPCTTCGGRGTC